MEWVVQVNSEVNHLATASEEGEHWKKWCIYKVPACITDLNKKAYRPQAVSFGPYHHGEKHLCPAEDQKRRALLHFLKRSGKHLDPYLESLHEVEQDLKDCYHPLDAKWQDDTAAFLKLMILDGCFMLEILRTVKENTMNDYAANDPIFSSQGKLHTMPYIKRDMLMIENQLPMLVLDRLVAVESDGKKGKGSVTQLIIDVFAPGVCGKKLGECLHVLDVYRKSNLRGGLSKRIRSKSCPRENEGDDEIIRSATELDEAGIRFEKSGNGRLWDISFNRGILRLPVIVIDNTTESFFSNVIAFERFHVEAGYEMTSYIFFMDNIINSERDVALLHSKGIIQNAIGSDKAVAKLFNTLSRDATLDPQSRLSKVHKEVSRYCKKHMWRANLTHKYFRNPWSILSLIAAIFLFALIIIQTIFTIRSPL